MDRRAALASLGGLGLTLRFGGAARAQGYRVLDATETVQIEHQDREARLKRIAGALQISPPPEFHEAVVPAERAPASFHVDVPVLRVVFAEKSFFDTARSTLRPEGYLILRAIAECLRGDAPDTAVFVAGHTDSRGSEPYNYNLSVSRADAVAQALFQQNVGAVALWRVGFGEAVPLYPNDSAEHMSYNRRVEFLFAARTAAVIDTLKRQLGHVCVASDPRQADQCKQTIELRSTFEAVQLTDRRVDLPPAPPPRTVERSRGRPGAIAQGAGPGSVANQTSLTRVKDGPKLQHVEMNIRKIDIAMEFHQYNIGSPNR